jgi:hypothetical protein
MGDPPPKPKSWWDTAVEWGKWLICGVVTIIKYVAVLAMIAGMFLFTGYVVVVVIIGDILGLVVSGLTLGAALAAIGPLEFVLTLLVVILLVLIWYFFIRWVIQIVKQIQEEHCTVFQ